MNNIIITYALNKAFSYIGLSLLLRIKDTIKHEIKKKFFKKTIDTEEFHIV